MGMDDGRWIAGVGTINSHEDAPKLAALLMFQALRLDLTVAATCRVMPLRKQLMPPGIFELDPNRRSTPMVGADRVPSNAVPRPVADEALLRALLRGYPQEQQLMSALQYVNAA